MRKSDRKGFSSVKVLRWCAAVFLAAMMTVSGVSGVFASESEGEGLSSFLGSLKDAVEGLSGEDDGVYNLLLIGVDRRDASWNGNSDSMILISVNDASGKITMMSFMRDLGVEIEGYGLNKLNSAYAIGGPDFLVSTLQNVFGVRIDNYACADFRSMIATVDALGGIEITLSDKEAELANGLIIDMAGIVGDDPEPHLFPGGGTYLSDGYQTVGYARVRFVGNNDYERTERQRSVLSSAADRIRSMSGEELASFAASAFTLIRHNLSAADILQLAAKAPDILHYDLVQSRVPYDGLYSGQNEMLIPVQPDTNERIAEELAA